MNIAMDAFEIDDSRDEGSSTTRNGELVDGKSEATHVIRTNSLFPFMELPTELRLKIYPYLLVSEGDISINPVSKSSTSVPCSTSSYPSVEILQTCKRVNEEATPILYARNEFIIYLTMDPEPYSSLANSFLLSSLRWTSISHLTSLTFISNSSPLPGIDPIFPENTSPRSRPFFTCTGADIISRFSSRDFRYAPNGPDQYMALSLSNWISTQVMRAMLSAFQRELEAMMRPSDLLAVGNGNAAQM